MFFWRFLSSFSFIIDKSIIITLEYWKTLSEQTSIKSFSETSKLVVYAFYFFLLLFLIMLDIVVQMWKKRHFINLKKIILLNQNTSYSFARITTWVEPFYSFFNFILIWLTFQRKNVHMPAGAFPYVSF